MKLTELPDLLVNRPAVALAMSEGVNLASLRVPSPRRPSYASKAGVERPLHLLDWSGKRSSGFDSPASGRSFFEEYELFPGLVVRGWGHPKGRLGFGLNDGHVIFELHAPVERLLIRGTPNELKISLGSRLPDTVFASVVGRPLECLIRWPPAGGSEYVVSSAEEHDGHQALILHTTPLSLTSGPQTYCGLDRNQGGSL